MPYLRNWKSCRHDDLTNLNTSKLKIQSMKDEDIRSEYLTMLSNFQKNSEA